MRKQKKSGPPCGNNRVALGLCKPGLIVLTVAYNALMIAALLVILFPDSFVGKLVGLGAYICVAGVLNQKLIKAITRLRNRPSAGRRGESVQK